MKVKRLLVAHLILLLALMGLDLPARADVLLPASLTAIEEQAFLADSTLSGALVIPEGTQTIGSAAFKNCSGITSVSLPATVRSIGAEAFSGCSQLKGTIVLASDVEVGSDAFAGCPGLTIVRRTPEEEALEALSYTVAENGVTITDYTGDLRRLVVPAAIEGKPVTAIDDYVGRYSDTLEQVILPDSITSIGYGAFSFCDALKTAMFPSRLENISAYSFAYCPLLSGSYELIASTMENTLFINSPSVSAMGYSIMEDGNLELTLYAGNDEQVTVPATCAGIPVKHIGSNVFENFDALKKLTISEGVESLDWYSIASCEALTEIRFPQSLKKTTGYSIYNCAKLASTGCFIDVEGIRSDFVDCPLVTCWAVESNGDGNCTLIDYRGTAANVTVPEAFGGMPVTALGDYAFSSCTMETVTLPDTLVAMGNAVFNYCSNLRSLNIPESIHSFGSQIFGDCSALTGEYHLIQTEYPQASSIFSGCGKASGFTYKEQEDGTLSLRSYAGTDASVTIPDKVQGKTVSHIYYSAFSNAATLEHIQFPAGLTAIDSNAFVNCANLKGTYTLVGVKFSKYAFAASEGLEVFGYLPREDQTLGLKTYIGSRANVVLPDTVNDVKVTAIDSYAFSDVSCLQSIQFPAHLRELGSGVFENCTALQGKYQFLNMSMSSNTFPVQEGLEVWNFNSNDDGTVCLTRFVGTGTLEIPSSFQGKTVTQIDMYGFSGNKDVHTVVIPDSVRSIASLSFEGSSSLTGVNIPSGCDVGEFAFSDCSGLSNVTLGSNVSVGNYAFYGTPFLRSKTQAIINQICSSGDSDFKKALAVHDWIIYNCNYDHDYTVNDFKYASVEGILFHHKAVCSGYAWTFEYFMNLLGIDVYYVEGSVPAGEHAWNLVKLDGEWYQVDCTWDDPGTGGYERKTYCFITDETMAKDHTWDTTAYPAATGTRYLNGVDHGE